MSAPIRLGTLAGQPVEFTQSHFHPDDPVQSGMVCGSPRRWLKWGTGSWVEMSDRAKLFALPDWLAVEWSPEDATTLWADHCADLSGWTQEQHQKGPFNAAAHIRWRNAHHDGARRYARGIGVMS